ncbi:unnamed protein product [Meganyctiphanes norvegica]|uniref:Protein sleepless n=1 Tax=Meganyctiphanes norvegica TaxID=48144 RepID=A0AAV2R2P6_MEGNR
MDHLLLIFCLSTVIGLQACSATHLWCYYCDNNPDKKSYDPACSEDNYRGDSIDSWNEACYTSVHYDGSHRVIRYLTNNPEKDGACFDSGFAITCYCISSKDSNDTAPCNGSLCDHCKFPNKALTSQPSLMNIFIFCFVLLNLYGILKLSSNMKELGALVSGGKI